MVKTSIWTTSWVIRAFYLFTHAQTARTISYIPKYWTARSYWNISGYRLERFASTMRLPLMFKRCWKIKDSSYLRLTFLSSVVLNWAAPSEFGTYRLCEQRRFRRACASAQSRQNLRCSLIQAVSQEEPSDRKPDPWPLWMAEHAQLKFVMTECSKTQIRLTGLN